MPWREGPFGYELTTDYGAIWDDGAHGRVQKIRISYNTLGINFVRFCYGDGVGNRTITIGNAHGVYSDHDTTETKEFTLALDEYIKVVTAYSGYGVRKIEFETNKQTIECGVESHDPLHIYEAPIIFASFVGENKIVGFHGRSGVHFLHQLGVHWSPI